MMEVASLAFSVTFQYLLWPIDNTSAFLSPTVILSPASQLPSPVPWFMHYKSPPSYLQIISSCALLRSRGKKFPRRVLPDPTSHRQTLYHWRHMRFVGDFLSFCLHMASLIQHLKNRTGIFCVFTVFLESHPQHRTESLLKLLSGWLKTNKKNSQSLSWDFLRLYLLSHLSL